MKRKPNGLNKPNDVIVFDISEASVTGRMSARSLKYVALGKGVRHVGTVYHFINQKSTDDGRIVILIFDG